MLGGVTLCSALRPSALGQWPRDSSPDLRLELGLWRSEDGVVGRRRLGAWGTCRCQHIGRAGRGVCWEAGLRRRAAASGRRHRGLRPLWVCCSPSGAVGLRRAPPRPRGGYLEGVLQQELVLG